jgi:DNA (cytosine-5)-methyltransferase 1
MNTKVISFFSGLGFLDLGFEDEGFEVVFANEIHKPFSDAYLFARRGIPEKTKTQISNLSIEALLTAPPPSIDRLIRRTVSAGTTIFIGGPPCPDFSVGGKNKGKEGENGRLSSTYVDIICKYKPHLFLFENVKGLWRTKKHRAFYDSIKEQLGSQGYVLTERLTNSLELGVAQDRDRIILLGALKLSKPGQLDERIKNFDWDAMLRYREFEKFRITPKGVRALKNLPKELTVAHWFDKNKVTTHPNQKHAFTPRAGLIKFKTIAEGDTSKKSFKRLHRYRYSPTAAYGNNEVHIHPTEPRRISAAEALAIQSLPSNFVLPQHMTLTDMFKGIGNGVPYLLARGIARQLKLQILKSSTR